MYYMVYICSQIIRQDGGILSNLNFLVILHFAFHCTFLLETSSDVTSMCEQISYYPLLVMSLFNSVIKDKQGCVSAVLALTSHISDLRILMYLFLGTTLGYFLIVFFPCFSYVKLTCGLF